MSLTLMNCNYFFCYNYADDAVLFVRSSDALESMLVDLQMYCNVNTMKSKIMISRMERKRTCLCFRIMWNWKFVSFNYLLSLRMVVGIKLYNILNVFYDVSLPLN